MRTDSPFTPDAGFKPEEMTVVETPTFQQEDRSFDSRSFEQFVKAQPPKTSFRVSVRLELPIEGKEGRCFLGLSSVKVTRKAWQALGLDLIEGVFESRGARIPVRIVTDERPHYSYRAVYIG